MAAGVWLANAPRRRSTEKDWLTLNQTSLGRRKLRLMERTYGIALFSVLSKLLVQNTRKE
ncbi:hypothetical protein E2C01_046029 [Portunus trituberculatus]|uniref:Uncharacterized protein n=1 Tax=Portunus trituberculatus TaxID=210409 RepID=A0A5B7G3I6_PORTR|nr:hypothetical protein [Portunus trituberculatus]